MAHGPLLNGMIKSVVVTMQIVNEVTKVSTHFVHRVKNRLHCQRIYKHDAASSSFINGVTIVIAVS